MLPATAEQQRTAAAAPQDRGALAEVLALGAWRDAAARMVHRWRREEVMVVLRSAAVGPGTEDTDRRRRGGWRR